jgi:3-dehydroquinate dehydratase/shikimate dehydrogenase
MSDYGFRPLLCVTVTAATTAELRARRDSIRDADLVELRLDSVTDPDVAGALAGRRKPIILTCRPSWEGGAFAGSEEERHRLLADALSLGAEYVDIEWRAGFGDLIARTGGRRIILSTHDFTTVPADLRDRAVAMRAAGAEIIKLAVAANRLSDCIPLQRLGRDIGREGRTVLIAMGGRGVVSRVLPARFGSAWSYAGAIEGVGQMTPSTMLHQYRFASLTASTAIYGLVGSPIEHSVSPDMHNAALGAAGIDAVYLPLRAVDADDFVDFARAFALKGASVTIPFKVPLLPRVDEVDETARLAGAINTIRVDEGRWLGRNTDAAAFLRPLEQRRIGLGGARVAVLGAGGAARAVGAALRPFGAHVTMYARDAGRAGAVAAGVGARAAAWPPPAGSWDLLVNCTPVGMYPRGHESPVPRAALTGRVVYDLVYNPPATRLLGDARSAGCSTINGLEMLVAQAQEQFEWWTGLPAPSGIMRDAAERRLAEFSAHEDHVA